MRFFLLSITLFAASTAFGFELTCAQLDGNVRAILSRTQSTPMTQVAVIGPNLAALTTTYIKAQAPDIPAYTTSPYYGGEIACIEKSAKEHGIPLVYTKHNIVLSPSSQQGDAKDIGAIANILAEAGLRRSVEP